MALVALVALVAPTACQAVGGQGSEAPVGVSAAAPTSPRDPAAPTIVEIEIETGFGCVLDSAGSIRCWGDRRGPAGQPRPSWELAVVSEASAAAVDIVSFPRQGEPWICAALVQGEVECWRLFADGEHLQIPGIADAVEVDQHLWTCARSKSGEVHCWTMDDVGAIQTVFDRAIDIDLHFTNNCALDAEGGVWCWLPPTMLQCATHHDPRESRLRATKVASIPGAVEIKLYWDNACVRTESGELWCTGKILASDNYGVEFRRQDGIDDVIAPLAGPIQAIGRSVSSTCAVNPSGIWCWGTRSTGYHDDPEPELHELDRIATSVVASGDQTCVTTPDQELLCWGYRLPYPATGTLGMVEPVELAHGQPPVVALEGRCWLDDAGGRRCGRFEANPGGPSIGRCSTVWSGAASSIVATCTTVPGFGCRAS